MVKPIIFISAVSEEFRGLRRDVADALRKLGYDPHSQESLPTLEGDLRQALREQIDQCEGVIQLVGAAYGAEPPTEDEDFGRCSYTQFVYRYARRSGKRIWTFFAAERIGVGRDRPIARLDLPRLGADIPDPATFQSERRELQQRFVGELHRDGQTRPKFRNREELLSQVDEIQEELLQLKEHRDASKRPSKRSAARVARWAILVGIPTCLTFFAFLLEITTGQLTRQICQVPVVHGACRGQGWGGIPTRADEERFAEAAGEGCPGLRAYLADPDAHPVLSQKAQQALAGLVVERSETWEIKDNLTHPIDVGVGLAPLAEDEQSAREAALQQARLLAARQCLLPTAGEDFRQPADRAPAVLRDVEFACEQVRARHHCKVSALAHCLLERRTYITTETCHVAD